MEDDQEFQVVGDISELQAQAEAEGSKDEATSSGNTNQSAAIGNTSVFKLLQTEKKSHNSKIMMNSSKITCNCIQP